MADSVSVSAARTGEEILDAMARWCLWEAHRESDLPLEYPADKIPSVAALGKWLRNEPQPAGTEWEILRVAAETALCNRFLNGILERGHQTWLDQGGMDGGPHPWAGVVRAWQERGRPAGVDRSPVGIMPAFASELIAPSTLVRPPAGRLSPLSLRRPDSSGQLLLPGLHVAHGDHPALMLALLDAGSEPKPGAGAPLRDRCFVEFLMMANRDDRVGGERFRLRAKPGEGLTIRDPVLFAGWNLAHYRPNSEKTGLALDRALAEVNGIKLPLNDRGGWLIPVFVDALEGRRLRDRLNVWVRLLAGSDRGASVNRAALRQAGKASAVAWRLYLSLCFEWNRVSRRGRPPHLTRPERARNDAGYLVDASGKVLTDKRGRPMREGKHARSVETGRREPNPMGVRLHRVYDGPRDLVRMVWPFGTAGSAQNPRRSERAVIAAARWLAGDIEPDGSTVKLNRHPIASPAVRIVQEGHKSKTNPHEFPWRMVPPRLK